MGTRHTGRKLAMQVLFQADIQQALDITDVMTDYHQKANKLLAELPESTYRTSLEQLVQFTIDRTK